MFNSTETFCRRCGREKRVTPVLRSGSRPNYGAVYLDCECGTYRLEVPPWVVVVLEEKDENFEERD